MSRDLAFAPTAFLSLASLSGQREEFVESMRFGRDDTETFVVAGAGVLTTFDLLGSR